MEAGTSDAARDAVAGALSSIHGIPSTLQASLMARLDRLGPAKDVARIAAGIGREFSYELLAAVAGLQGSELTTSLSRLTSAGLLYQEGTPPDATFLFKHALIRDAAYATLLRGARRDLHGRIGTKLEEIFPHFGNTQPDLLAYHFEQGGVSEKAVEYWLKAGQQSLARAAMTEASSHLNKGLALLSGLPDDAWRRSHELSLQVALASVLIATLGPASPTVGEAYQRARRFWEGLNRPSHFEPMIALFWHHLLRGELETAHQMATELAFTGSETHSAVAQCIGSLYLAETCLCKGDFAQARSHSENCLILYNPVDVSRRLMFNARVAALIVLSRSLFCVGQLDQARFKQDQALSEARQLANPYALAFVLMTALHIVWGVHSVDSLLKLAEELIGLNFNWISLQGAVFRGWCLSVFAKREGASVIRDAIAAYRATGSLRYVPFFLLLQTDAYRRSGQWDAALQSITEALRLMQVTHERWIEAELHRVRGDLLAWMGEQTSSELCFQESLAVARRQNAKIWELRTSISLARLWSNSGKHIEARNLLAPLYDSFTEGLETPNLQEARKLLAELIGTAPCRVAKKEGDVL